MPEAVIVAAVRSPIGRAVKGSLASIRPDDLATQTVAAALAQVPGLRPTSLDDLFLGCAHPCGEQSFNLARVVAILLGLDHLPGVTVNRYCASSAQTTRMAFHAVKVGEGDAFIAGGVESVSHYPEPHGPQMLGRPEWHHPVFAAASARSAAIAAENQVWTDPRDEGLLPDIYLAMGQSAENVATFRQVSRQRQDEWAALSHSRTQTALGEGFFAREIVPITLPDGRVVETDDCPRRGMTVKRLSSLQPAFRTTGTVTVGNCCPVNDGAAALVITSDLKAKELGLTPLARIVSTGVSAVSPEIMGLGAVGAARQALKRAGMSIGDMDLYEINEAFAAQVLPCADDLGMDPEKLNVHGGAIALGHPFGATGARLATTLLNGLSTQDRQFGLLTMCVGGGQGMAVIIERLS